MGSAAATPRRTFSPAARIRRAGESMFSKVRRCFMRFFLRCIGYSLGCLLAALPAPFLLAGEQERFRRGDVNSDGMVDISDPITELDFLFLGGGKIGCPDAADAN